MKSYNTYLVIGLQWGDEGKGKIINLLSEDADYVVSYQGGNNAGHSIFENDIKTKLDMLPLGILNTKGKCILASGLCIELDSLLDEVHLIEKNFKSVDNLYIDGRANIIMPYHILLDQIKAKKENLVKNRIVKKMGFNPCYTDKITHNNIRMIDLLDTEIFSKKLFKILKEKNEILVNNNEEAIDFEYIYQKYEDYAKSLKNIIVDTVVELNNAIDKGKKVVFEASLSTMMDYNFGTYPNNAEITSISSSVSVGTGVAQNKISNVIGVFKAYSTRVLNGIFPTEITGQLANDIRNAGNEYVTDTGLARRCGWLDMVILKYTCMINGITELHITKLDVLTGLEKIKLAIGYEIDGIVYQYYPMNYDENKQVNVLYKEFDSWTEDISNITNYEDLPENCKRYIEYIEGYLEIKIKLISVGVKKEQTIFKNYE